MLAFLDVLIIIIYFIIISIIGLNYSKRQKNTKDYFKGGERIPSWAAGLSIFGTVLSPITFIAIPSKAYSTDWSYFLLNISVLLVIPVIFYLFIPFYRKTNVKTAYEYLEIRFNLTMRLIGCICFILYQVGRIGVVLFLPSIALNLVTGIDIFICISLMGIISLIYTLFGGIEAVIWTDVIQVFVLMGGIIISLLIIASNIDGGFEGILEMAYLEDKFNIFDFTLSFTEPTIWVMIFGGFFINLTTYGTDYTIVQRYLITPNIGKAQKSIWLGILPVIPSTLIFFFIGTALFIFYKINPTALNTNFISDDAIFPWYIVTQLPIGVSGILIAAIFAAAMSSLSSSMNAGAASFSIDIFDRLGLGENENSMKIARWATFIIGMFGILFAFFMASSDIKSLWDEFNKILGLIFGSLGGVFLLGILTKKANSKGVLFGILISFSIQFFLSQFEFVHLLLYAATGVISCFVFGYTASVVFRESKL